jgi:bacterioferritin-associated ferredoxin
LIICSCNVFSDGEVRAAGTAQIFRDLGHEPQCGRCVRTIRNIMNEALPAGERF